MTIFNLVREVDKPQKVSKLISSMLIGDELIFASHRVDKIGSDQFQIKKPARPSEVVSKNQLINYIKKLI